jgi:aryl-alcohol dehydrogenase-like predicted oxidoreductase
MNQRRLGSLTVSTLGLGCMGMSAFYGSTDEDEAIATIQRALDLGVNFIDTAQLYGPMTNEELVGRAINGRRDEYVIATKFARRIDNATPGDMSTVGPVDGSPEWVRNSIEGSLQRLGTDHVDLYYQHRVDPQVPIEETIGAIADMIAAGYVRHVGLSEAGAETIRRAHATHPVADLQIEYSLLSRGIEAEILPTCRELGVGVTAYGVLSRGLLGGHWSPRRAAAPGDIRARLPRFRPGNLERNLALVDALGEIAAAKGATVAQLAIAWVLARGDDIVPLVGTTRRDRLAEALKALQVQLSEDDLATIEAAAPPGAAAGARYDERQMAMLDSERSRPAAG